MPLVPVHFTPWARAHLPHPRSSLPVVGRSAHPRWALALAGARASTVWLKNKIPHSRALLHTNCPDVSHFAQMESYFAQNTTPNPCSLLHRHTPFQGYVRTQNTPNPAQKHPFSWPEFECWQNELPSGRPGPQLGKLFKNWTKTF